MLELQCCASWRSGRSRSAGCVSNRRRIGGRCIALDDYLVHGLRQVVNLLRYLDQLLVLALYRMYQEQGRSFIPSYVNLLERGGSGSPAELLGSPGVDIADPTFWSKGFAEVERLIARMRDLVEGSTT